MKREPHEAGAGGIRRAGALRRALGPILLAGAAAVNAAGELSGQQPAVIEMFDRAFLPTSVSIRADGVVTWIWRGGAHIIASGLSSQPEDDPGALFEGRVDSENPSFSFQFRTPGEYPFFDRLNEQAGGIGRVNVLSDAVTFRVGVVDNVYIPEHLFIFEGDTVHWEHEPGEMYHTVTSGRSSRPEDDPGALFNADSSDEKPNFFYTFTAPMLCPYFCVPHEDLGMAGDVTVQRIFLRGDSNDDAVLDISDASHILSVLFLGEPPGKCPDASDANDDGLVDVSDAVAALTYLFLGGEALPPPFPRAGPDRTEDNFLCGP